MWQNENIELNTSEDELEHAGVKGMKWGRRRYQNPDGSLTALGKKRYLKGEQGGSKGNIPKKKKLEDMSANELKKEIERRNLADQYNTLKGKTGIRGFLQKRTTSKMSTSELKKEIEREELLKQLNGDKNKKDDKADEKPKSFKDMSDDELRAETARMQAEKQYKEAEKQLKEASKSELRKFGDKAIKTAGDAALEAGKDVTKQFLVKWGKKALNIDQPDKEVEALKREAEIAKQKNLKAMNDKSAWEKTEELNTLKNNKKKAQEAEKESKKAEESKKEESNSTIGKRDMSFLKTKPNTPVIERKTGDKGVMEILSEAKSKARSGETINEIAKDLNVSASTVSRALGGTTKSSVGIERKSGDDGYSNTRLEEFKKKKKK